MLKVYDFRELLNCFKRNLVNKIAGLKFDFNASLQV